MSDVNRRIVLASRPHGEPTPAHFRLERGTVPVAHDGEVLLRNHYLSLDPYMRGRMSAAKSYAKPVEINDVMVGATVSEVVASHHPGFAVGETVLAYGGWQDFAVSNGQGLRKLDPSAAPVTTALGVLGMPGMTAYTGLLTIGAPKAGETVVVAAATGPVGSLVGQIARLKGARTVGIAGGPTSAATSPRISASTRRSTTGPATCRPRSRRPARTASTSISRMSAARCSTRCCRC